MDDLVQAFNDFVHRDLYHKGKRKPPTAKQRKKAANKRRMQKKSRR